MYPVMVTRFLCSVLLRDVIAAINKLKPELYVGVDEILLFIDEGCCGLLGRVT